MSKQKKFKYASIGSNKRRPSPIKRFLKIFILTALVLSVIGISIIAGIFVYFSKDLPKLDRLSDYSPKVKTKVYSKDNELIGEFYVENRELVNIGEVPDSMINAIIAAEDQAFFEHKGIDYFGILRAAYVNFKAGGVKQGASTITQQVAKTFLLSSERIYSRKIKELILASRIEEKFTKQEILHLYLNQIFFGHNSFGIKVAAQNYFGKEVSDLNVAESALLAALPKAPTSTSPFVNPKKARDRQKYVLGRMKKDGFISESEYESAKEYELRLKEYVDLTRTKAPYFTEHIRRYLKSKYGDNAVYKEGLTVYTTVDVDLQKAAQAAIKKGLVDLDRRQGYRGVRRHLGDDEIDEFIMATSEDEGIEELVINAIYEDYAVITKINDNAEESNITIQLGKHTATVPLDDFTWARKPDPEIPWFAPGAAVRKPSEVFKVGDVIDVKITERVEKEETKEEKKDKKEEEPEKEEDELPYAFSLYQEPVGQAALVSYDVQTGFINVMVGGYDFDKSEFNRVVQAKRLPGSAFKPVIYSAAIDWIPKDGLEGEYFTPAKVIYDTALVFEDGKWKPSNYGKKFKGAVSLRKALNKSINIPAVKVLSTIGVNYFKRYSKDLGIDAYINPDPTAALGSSAMTLLDLSTIYGIFASGGLRIEPVFVTKVVDRHGNVLEEFIAYEDTIKEEPLEKEKEEVVKEGSVTNDIAALNEAVPEEADILSADGTGAEEEKKEDPRRVMDAGSAYIMTNLLQSVVQDGTGWRVKKVFKKIPLAGKTGTTNNYIDAWFMGFSPDIVTGVWVGFDEERSLGKSETGSRSAAPIWVDFMKEALKDKPVKNFLIPEDIEFIKIDPKTGLLARPDTKDAKFECFKKGTVPTEYTTETDEEKPEDFFIDDLEEESNYQKSKNNIDDPPNSMGGEEDETIPVAIP